MTDRTRGVSRRRFLICSAGAVVLPDVFSGVGAEPSLTPARAAPPAATKSVAGAPFWWQGFFPFAQIADPAAFAKTAATVDIHGCSNDPTWGPYAQQLSVLDARENFRKLKAAGVRVITWIEGFGDCMLYAVSLERRPDGSFEARGDDSAVTRVFRSHWDWANRDIPPGNTLRWVGLHNTINDEDFVGPGFSRERQGIPVPRYPDGRAALGWRDGVLYPLNARLYDACGAKDLHGRLTPNFEPPSGVNDRDPATGQRRGPVEGLYPAVLGRDDVAAVAGLKPGDTVYCGVISVHKDLSAPFWREYVRHSVRQLVRHGLDGVWCDNYSPWDNFGYPPLQKAFGDWSVALFQQYLDRRTAERAAGDHGPAAPIASAPDRNVRSALAQRAVEFGARDPERYDDPAWRDPRWRDEPTWQAYKAFRQAQAKQDLRRFYESIHDEATKGGRPDFCIGGNDIPFYGLGWVQDGWLDMVNTELTAGWHMGTGSRGITLPPAGKMAPVYRAALEHQKGPFCAAWYYLNGTYARYQGRPELAKVLLAEAFANGAFLLCDPDNDEVVGPVEVHAEWNRFIRQNQNVLAGRQPVAEVGVLFSPDNQLYEMAPGGFVDMDRQPHIFGYYGWATALTEAHIPYRAVPDWKLDQKHLSGLRVLVLPDAACLSGRAGSEIEHWVRQGGRLVMTGPCATRYEPAGWFGQRPRSLFADILGHELNGDGPTVHDRPTGEGTVSWTPDSVGMEYYLQLNRRPALLPGMLPSIGPERLVTAPALPTTVGLTMWRSADHRRWFVDLVNYDIDLEEDRVCPAEGLEVRLSLQGPFQHATLVAPSGSSPLPLPASGTGFRLPRLEHYASVVLE